MNCKSAHELEISKKRKSTRQCKGFWVYPRSNFLLIDRGSIYAIEVSSEHCHTSSLQNYFIEITAEIGRQGQDCNQAQTYSFNHRAGIEFEPQVDLTLVEENGSDIESATRLTRKVELMVEAVETGEPNHLNGTLSVYIFPLLPQLLLQRRQEPKGKPHITLKIIHNIYRAWRMKVLVRYRLPQSGLASSNPPFNPMCGRF